MTLCPSTTEDLPCGVNIYVALFSYTRALGDVILNHGQLTCTTPELVPPLLATTPHQREEVSALERFNVHRSPTQRVFSGTGLELVRRPATSRYLDHSATAATLPCGGADASLIRRGSKLSSDVVW
ncbi:uncharacterized protein TNCV_398061 [Trichonephila clavipes]|nr:uncharacterized protein TNCV_398061 [Trichonephila clavipes]